MSERAQTLTPEEVEHELELDKVSDDKAEDEIEAEAEIASEWKADDQTQAVKPPTDKPQGEQKASRYINDEEIDVGEEKWYRIEARLQELELENKRLRGQIHRIASSQKASSETKKQRKSRRLRGKWLG